MAAAAVDSDIDSFIREQKAKLANERQALNAGDSRLEVEASRRHWDRPGAKEAKLAEEKESQSGRRQRRPVTPAEDTGLPVGEYQKRRKELDEQRQREYKEYLQQKQHDYQQTSKQLAQQRRQEYNEMLAAKEKQPKHQVEESGFDNPVIIPFNRAEEDREKKRRLEEERHREYQQIRAKENLKKRHFEESGFNNPTIFPYNRAEEERKRKKMLKEQRNLEYQQLQAKLAELQKGPQQQPSDEHQGLPVGQYEKSRQKVKEQQEYRQMLEQQLEEKKRLRMQMYGMPPDGVPRRTESEREIAQPSRDIFARRPQSAETEVPEVRREPPEVSRLPLTPSHESDQSTRNPRQSLSPTRVKSPEHLGLDVGGYEKVRDQLREERHQEYLRSVAAKRGAGGVSSRIVRSRLRDEGDDYKQTWSRVHQQDDPRRVGNVSHRSDEAKFNVEASIQRAMAKREKEEYEKLWERVHGQKKPARPAGDLSPRRHDIEASLALLEHTLDKQQYGKIWHDLHSNKSSPRAPPPRHTEAINGDVSYRGSKPRGGFDIEASIKRAERKWEDRDYKDTWKKLHGDSEEGPEKKSKPQENPQPSRSFSDQQRQKLQEERKQELQQYLEQKEAETKEKQKRRQWDTEGKDVKVVPDTETQAEAARRRLAEERQREYRELREKSAHKTERRKWQIPETADAELALPLGKYEDKHRQLQQERQQEYKDLLKSKSEGRRTWREPSSEKLLPLGEYENKRKAIEAERNREYKEYLRQQGGQRSLVQQTDEYKANLPGMNESDNAKDERLREADDSWWTVHYLKEDKNFVDIKPYSAHRNMAQVTADSCKEGFIQKVRERNAEYNQFLREKQGQERSRGDGGQAPQDEGIFATLPGLHYSDSASKRRQQERNQEYNQMLREKAARGRPVRGEVGDIGRPPPAPRKGWSTPTYEEMLDKKRQQEAQYRRGNDPGYGGIRSYGSEGALNLDPRSEPRRTEQSGPFYATLPLGETETGSAKRREKENYRDALQQQMREAEDSRRREKDSELQVNYTGLKGPEAVVPIIRAPPPASRSRGSKPAVEPYHSKILDGLEKLDTLSPRSEVILGRRRLEDFDREQKFGGASSLNLKGPSLSPRPLASRGGTSLLDNGFENLLEAPRRSAALLAPPPGLEYQPASYITQGAGAGVGIHGSVDEAYNFYATRNPLDSDIPGRAYWTNKYLHQLKPRGGIGDFPTDDDKKREAHQKAQAYQEELNRQMQEKKLKKQREREEQERYERKLEREAQEYNPFGRGGGGAPMRDAGGNIMADLRQMHRPSSFRDDLIGPPPVQTTAEGEQSHARGGHGIFGMPKTDAEKVASERYKDELRRQIEEKKLEEMRKKDKEREEEEREQRRVEEQQRRMQAEYEEERRKIREKEEEARRKNEELVRIAEERKREAERKRREQEEERQEELRREKEAEMNARLAAERDQRGKSPVIPALQHKQATETKENAAEARGGSPPVPAARTRTAEPDAIPSTSRQEVPPMTRTQSADVLNQLASMRQQLQNERARVEGMLQSEKNEPDVFDPRLVQRPPPAPVVRPEIDVFETAVNRNPVSVRRTPGDRANSQAIEDFNALKHKNDTDSRKEFRSMFPDQPLSSDMLEAQQAAMLRQQEQQLQAMRQQRDYDSGYPKSKVPRSPRVDSRTPQQLHSNSAFVDVDSLNYFPDDFEDIPPSNRNESARSRRRNRLAPSPQVGTATDPFGSTTSLNVDRLARKNEDRLKRLRELQGDDLSLYDPDDVLDRFMSKQAHNRPPSGQTLQDDSWMNAGAASKVSGY
ncbi:hypothetical protein BaRGS_00026090 [Batillaria attramentaria]|uniref:Centrosome and spindle pole-associated protein 1 C-terminal domain-containing protein n=1 Tax=Batillaria attramentaria TaxID=370345 RepID=A0ABD0K6U3_9CAEN